VTLAQRKNEQSFFNAPPVLNKESEKSLRSNSTGPKSNNKNLWKYLDIT